MSPIFTKPIWAGGRDRLAQLPEQSPPDREPGAGSAPDAALARYGRTRGDKLVHFPGHVEPGDPVCVRIERASPWSLAGTATEERVAELA
jgi:hypothetical protein